MTESLKTVDWGDEEDLVRRIAAPSKSLHACGLSFCLCKKGITVSTLQGGCRDQS